VFRSVKHAVFWGIAHVDWDGITAIGIDEIQWQRGHRYLTLVYQIDAGRKRLLWIGRERTTKTLEGFFRIFGQRASRLKFVCSDMWRPYLEVVARRAKRAIHVLDRYHVMAKSNRTRAASSAGMGVGGGYGDLAQTWPDRRRRARWRRWRSAASRRPSVR
jgi:transposase